MRFGKKKQPGHPGCFFSCESLYIEAEIGDVAVLHDIVLALQTEQPLFPPIML